MTVHMLYSVRLMGCVVLCSLGLTAPGHAQRPTRVLWVQQSDLPKGKVPASLAHYEPFGFMPDYGAKQISVAPKTPLARLAPDARPAPRGTCLEYLFRLRKAEEFLIAAHIPRGGAPGTRPGLDVSKLLVLAKEGEMIVLKFSARRRADSKARVIFGVGGLRAGEHVDDIETVITAGDEPIELTADWQEFEIPIVDDDGEPFHPKSVISPFRVEVKEQHNRAPCTVRVYVKDIRFEVVRAKAKPKE